jgi:hypothetical protein
MLGLGTAVAGDVDVEAFFGGDKSEAAKSSVNMSYQTGTG